MEKENKVGEAGLARFDLKKYLKDNKVSASDVAAAHDLTPQAYNYHLNTGVLAYSFIEVLSGLTGKTDEAIMLELKTNYILQNEQRT